MTEFLIAIIVENVISIYRLSSDTILKHIHTLILQL